MTRLLLACLAGLSLGGCTTELLRAEDASTQAVRAALAAQVIDRAGARGGAPLTGLDGRAAAKAQERYEKSFGAPKSAESIDASVLK